MKIKNPKHQVLSNVVFQTSHCQPLDFIYEKNKMRSKSIKMSLAFVACVFVLEAAVAQQEVFLKSNAAIQGYDPVAYFKDSRPVKGKNEFSYTWRGAKWLFANQENLDDFKGSPERFAPQFGGYCAYGVADGHKASTSPDAWTVVDGKLYLNYDKDVRELWKKDQKAFIKKANENWPVVKLEKD